MTDLDDTFYFNRAIALSRQALDENNDAFACVLVDSYGEIILEQTNTAITDRDIIAHDVLMLVHAAVKKFDRNYLKECTVYATMEPCVMCMGAVFWANIGNVKFAVSEKEYSDLRGGGGLEISSHEFSKRSPRKINVTGPYPALHDEIIEIIHAHIAKKQAERT